MTDNKDYHTLLSTAINDFNIDEVKNILTNSKINLNDYYYTPHIISAILNQFPEEVIRLFVEKGTDVSIVDKSKPILSLLIQNNYSQELADYLILHGAEIDRVSFWEDTICHIIADQINCMEWFHFVLKHRRSDIFLKVNRLNESVLLRYVKYQKDKEVIDFLLNLGIPIEPQPIQKTKQIESEKYDHPEKFNGWTPLFYLVEEYTHRNELVTFLIENHNASATAKTTHNYTLLMHAVRNNADMQLIQYLIAKGADPTLKNNYGKNCFTIACEYSKNVETVSYFYNINPDINLKTTDNITPLMYACMNPNGLPIVQFLVEKGCDIYTKTELSNTYYPTEYIPNHWTAINFAERNINGNTICLYLQSLK
jgi:ankyrin repeat protein